MPRKLSIPEAGPLQSVHWKLSQRTIDLITAEAADKDLSIGQYLDAAFAKRGNWQKPAK